MAAILRRSGRPRSEYSGEAPRAAQLSRASWRTCQGPAPEKELTARAGRTTRAGLVVGQIGSGATAASRAEVQTPAPSRTPREGPWRAPGSASGRSIFRLLPCFGVAGSRVRFVPPHGHARHGRGARPPAEGHAGPHEARPRRRRYSASAGEPRPLPVLACGRGGPPALVWALLGALEWRGDPGASVSGPQGLVWRLSCGCAAFGATRAPRGATRRAVFLALPEPSACRPRPACRRSDPLAASVAVVLRYLMRWRGPGGPGGAPRRAWVSARGVLPCCFKSSRARPARRVSGRRGGSQRI